MAKKTIPKIVKNKITEYVNILHDDKLPIKKVVLFGSYAKGTQHRWSDIDVCVISPKFKNSFSALQYLWSKREDHANPTIEPIGLSPKDFNDKYSSLASEIKKTGIEMPITS